jgi:hypothetical protein
VSNSLLQKIRSRFSVYPEQNQSSLANHDAPGHDDRQF